MNQTAAVIYDLTNCDREPIHIPGMIQPHGVLLVLQEPELTILQVSNNIEIFFGLPPDLLLNQTLEKLLGSYQTDSLKQVLTSHSDLQTINPFKLSIQSTNKSNSFNGLFHRSESFLILELETSLSQELLGFLDLYHLTRTSARSVQNTTSFQDLCQVIVHEIRKLTGLDRVMLYKFDPEGHGTILAEEKQEKLAPFLGLRYPKTDVPQQARQLYLESWVRLITDINYEPVEIIPATNPITHQPTDLSQSVLRSVSPLHVEYLQNMEVAASMSISIIKDKQLWGLIACHHYSPKFISYEIRSACEFLGQVMSLQLPYVENQEHQDYRIALKTIHNQLVEQMLRSLSFVDGLFDNHPNLLNLINAQGAAVWNSGDCRTIGITPQPDEIQMIVQWLAESSDRDIFQTHCLSSLLPEAETLKDFASGLLAVLVSPQHYILWFRPEVIQTVNWAGNPQKPISHDENGNVRLSPRKSFDLWKETVQLQSLPWLSCEVDAAVELQQAVVKSVLYQAAELAKLNQALQRSEAQEREKAAQLTIALQQLQQTQTLLIHGEKMSSLGQLVAGIAHEINNPVNFIYGNLDHAKHYAEGLLNILALYQTEVIEPNATIQKAIDEVDLEFLKEDLPKLLKSMQVGSERIKSLVTSLRNFSRLDEAEMKAVDIHEGIDSTLLILGHRLKPRSDHPGIHLVKQYGELPLVNCYASQLNQVFMNLLANAIDELETRDRARSLADIIANPSTIHISTAIISRSPSSPNLENFGFDQSSPVDTLVIRIKDNGSGIPEELQPRLFEPFFTTKPIGQGTGIGLAISYQITVEKHKGTLQCVSQPGQGTEFVIEIPLYPFAHKLPSDSETSS
ncbi:GAF domain-containing protein [Phormidium sp. CLA17]|uniref:ATP-binding protein n=1 Tax=Leptolyngbya sp. Cla-17 TaxID=2803751 RepID=UPI001491FAC3|nr:ATP-binding protein [Leptolyngbya sp. Cla-17]MBM0742746.1 GAF domain-containing protein [Leptolyngbya sp. Cla-17]